VYEVPPPADLKQFMADNNLTGADIAALTGVKPRSARQWVAPPGSKSYRAIPWAAWAMILILTGKKTKDEVFKMVDDWKREIKGWGIFEKGVAGRPLKEGRDD
jgi:hypothetical protein